MDLCKAAGADAYISGQGGRDYLEEGLFAADGLRLSYQEFRPPVYAQSFPGFSENLSAVDALFNAGSQAAEWIGRRDAR